MKKVLIRIAVLLVIFAGAVTTFAYLLNNETHITRSKDMASSSLPLVYMVYKEVDMNPLHGYVKPMEVTQVRDTLTPISTDRDVSIKIQTFGEKVEDVYFEVVTADGKTSLENTKVTNLKRQEETVTADFALQNQLRMNQEYVLKIQLRVDGRDVYYYTRVVQQDSLHTKEYLDFVISFSEKCLNKSGVDILALYMEPEENKEENNLSFMDIHTSTDQLVWGELNPQIYYKSIPTIKELNETTATIVQEYTISAQNEEGQTELYTVTEYFRLRYSNETVMLLDFERSTSEIFNPDNGVMTDNGIRLGITKKDISFISDADNQYFAFVQGGDLWSYDMTTGKMAQVFTFRQKNGSDYRDIFGQHEVKVISLDTNGNIYFVVAGYMNRGEHEGESGIALYRYDALAGGIEERLFVSTVRSYDLLKSDVNELTYVSEDDQHFFFLLDGDVYDVDLTSYEYTKVIEGMKPYCCVGSNSGKYMAYLEENEPYDSTTIQMMDLDTGRTTQITCGEEERLRPIGYMNDALVYGVANLGDIDAAHEGDELFPMKHIFIVNAQGERIKEYGEAGVYVTGGVIEDRLLTMTRVKKSDGAWTQIAEDHIIDNAAQESTVGMTTQVSARKQTEMLLLLGSGKVPKTPQVVRSRFVVHEEPHEVSIPAKTHEEERYYVYAKGKLDSIYEHANTAIVRANAQFGVVVNQDQQYIWERGNKADTMEIPLGQIPQCILKCEMDIDSLQAQLPDKMVLDLAGCDMEEILYFVGTGNPVIADTVDGPRVIIGYDQWANVEFYNPNATGEEVYKNAYYDENGEYVEESNKRTAAESYLLSDTDSLALFEESGNVFIGFLDKPSF